MNLKTAYQQLDIFWRNESGPNGRHYIQKAISEVLGNPSAAPDYRDMARAIEYWNIK